jgi:hypothetical protein
MAGRSKRTFKVLRGFDYGINGAHQYEPGDIVTDLPAEFVGWMLAEGTIVEAAPAAAGGKD